MRERRPSWDSMWRARSSRSRFTNWATVSPTTTRNTRWKWNGEKKYLLCVHCHDSHAPHYQPKEPLPPPLEPGGGRAGPAKDAPHGNGPGKDGP